MVQSVIHAFDNSTQIGSWTQPIVTVPPNVPDQIRLMEELISRLQTDLYNERAEKRERAHRTDPAEEINIAKERISELEEELRKEHGVCVHLQERVEHLENAEDQQDHTNHTSITRPKGTAGQQWSIQIEMGLAGLTKKTAIYQGLQRQLRDLALCACLNWENTWVDIPAGEKGKFYQVAREQNPFLKRFQNDWATEEIVKQYFKNKRKNHYKKGWLTVPEKYKHLKENSNRRNTSGSWCKRANTVLETRT